MRCYNHSDIEALATCFGCGKGLCKDCSQTNDTGIIICSEKCGARVNDQIEVIKLIRKKTLKQNKVSGFFCVLFGVIFGCFGIFQFTKENYFLPLAIFFIATSIGFIIGGEMYFKVAEAKA